MQESGDPLQSVLHMYRSHDNHPIGGVVARPLSRACTRLTVHCVNSTVASDSNFILGWGEMIRLVPWSAFNSRYTGTNQSSEGLDV